MKTLRMMHYLKVLDSRIAGFEKLSIFERQISNALMTIKWFIPALTMLQLEKEKVLFLKP